MTALPITREGVNAELRSLADKETLTSAEEDRFEQLLDAAKQQKRDNLRSEARALDPFDVDFRTASKVELRDRAMAIVEAEARYLAPGQLDQVDTLLRSPGGDVDGSVVATRILLTENDAYRFAFQKAVTQNTPAFTPEEVRALDEFRAGPMADGTNSLGGFGIPVFIDPSIILTSGAADAPILRLARIVQTTTNAWRGVNSAGVTWSFDAEGSVVSDDSPTLAQPVVDVYTARGFIPYTYEVGQDYPDFAAEMNMLLSQGFVDLMASQTMTGTGSSQPQGVFHAMNAITTNPAHVVVSTPGSLGAIDVRAAYAAVPERFRSRSTWVAHQSVVNKFSGFGNGNALSDYTVNLQTDGTPTLMGRPVVVTDYAPAFVGTTGAEQYTVVGDFSSFVIASRAGMSVELVPQLFDQATGRPNGTRGWVAWARIGSDVVNANGLRLLANS